MRTRYTAVELMLERGMRASQAGRPVAAIQAYELVLERQDATPRQLAIAAFNRAELRMAKGDDIGAVEDWGAVVERPGTPMWMMCRAWMARAGYRMRIEDWIGAICDCSAAIQYGAMLETHQEAVIESGVVVGAEWSPLEIMAKSACRRGRARIELGDADGALEDLLWVLKTAGISCRACTQAWGAMAEVMFLSRRFEEAEHAVRECLERDVTKSVLRMIVGLIRLRTGASADAVAECQEALEWVKTPWQLGVLERWLEGMVREFGEMYGVDVVWRLMEKKREEIRKSAKETGE